MSENITQKIYNEEIAALADDIANDCLFECDNDFTEAREMLYDRCHEVVDGHQWIIYYHYNDDVLKFASNDAAWEDVLDNASIGQIVTEKGMSSARTVQAFCAMLEDLNQKVSEIFDEKKNAAE